MAQLVRSFCVDLWQRKTPYHAFQSDQSDFILHFLGKSDLGWGIAIRVISAQKACPSAQLDYSRAEINMVGNRFNVAYLGYRQVLLHSTTKEEEYWYQERGTSLGQQRCTQRAFHHTTRIFDWLDI